MSDDIRTSIRETLLKPPRLSLISDHAITTNIEDDHFDLPFLAGPLYDVLRHPKTKTPMAAAVYGDWGTGKTSAMRWVQGRLEDWNKEGEATDKITVHSVWFAPWKYQQREDVWRGLIAEVMIACLKNKTGDNLSSLTTEAKNFARFLGKSVWGMIASLEFSAGGASLNGETLTKELSDAAQAYVSPEAAYLHPFEDTFKAWVGKCLNTNERMVVFIDDLDRCLPEVALQVLEALKLYLDIPGLAFVIGVDPKVINDLVAKRYKDLGLEEAKGRQYLAKMFQMEVTLAPNEGQVKDFLGSVLKDNDVWAEIEGAHQAIFHTVIHDLADGSPREIKRLVNSALIMGAGVKMSALAHDPAKTPPSTAQGVQMFLVRQVLNHRHPKFAHLLARDVGTAFFRQWHAEWHAVEGNTNATGYLPPAAVRNLRNLDQDRNGLSEDMNPTEDEAFEGVPVYLAGLVATYPSFYELLGEPTLAQLMRIEYPEQATAFNRIAIDEGDHDDQAIVDEAIAKAIGKTVVTLTDADRQTVTELDLSLSELRDLTPLASLKGLTELDLGGTEVSDLGPLANLTALTMLFLHNSYASDLAPLANLKALTALGLNSTDVSNLGPLANLTALTDLDIGLTQVSNLGPLANHKALIRLDLYHTPVSDEAVEELQAALPDLVIIR